MISNKNLRYFYCLLHTLALERHIIRTFISLVNNSLSPVDCKTAPNTAQTPAPTPPWLLPSARPRWRHLHDLRFTPSLFCLISCLGFRVSFLPRCTFPYNCHSKDPEIPCFSPSLSVQPQISALGAHLRRRNSRSCLPVATWQELVLQREFKAQRSLVALLSAHHTYPKWTGLHFLSIPHLSLPFIYDVPS